MNCKNVEPLLSLYVGRDLEEERARLVAAHLQSCTECTLAADEYDEANQLLQAYEPPSFGDEIYAGIRKHVLDEIEREFHVPGWPRIFSQIFLPLVQPRMRWITAVLLLAISVTALYLSRNRSPQLLNDRQVAVRTEKPNQAERGDVRTENSEPAVLPSLSNKGQHRTAATRRPMTGKRRANDRVVQRALDVSPPSSAAAPLRVEIQTSDRNIRIIWLSGPRPGSDVREGSKGI